MKTVYDYVNGIREFINETSITKRYKLLQQSAQWNQLCSSLDVIGDTELALDSFVNLRDELDTGNLYLAIYGALQALFIQQDAVNHLSEALDITIATDSVLHQIREIRNDSIGHPTKRKNKSFCFIQRAGLSFTSLKYMKVDSTDTSREFLEVNVLDLISNQREILSKHLLQILNKLKEEEMTHRHEFRKKKIVDNFPPTLSYAFGKMYESIGGIKSLPFGRIHLEEVQKCLADFQKELKTRAIEKVDSIEYLLKLLSYPLKELKKYFTEEDSHELNDESAYIFLFFVQKHIEELKKIAQEIDNEYFSDI